MDNVNCEAACVRKEEKSHRRAMKRFIVGCSVAAGLLLMGAMMITENVEEDVPSILLSSACIREMKPSCTVKVPGGKIHLSNIKFPNGRHNPGVAYASGVVNGE
jgi:hypothetical protein